MVLEVAILNVRPGESNAFEAAFVEAQKILSASRGYQRHELRRCVEATHRYLLLVWWDTLASHTQGFRESPEYQRWRALLHHFYDPFPAVEHYVAVPGAEQPGHARNTTATVIPTLKYDDAGAAIEWLCEAFGFEKHLVVPGENGAIVHAQLVFGNAMIMLGGASDDDFGKLQKPPGAVGRVGSQSSYLIVDDADEHYARAIAAGAEIVLDIKDEDYGGRGYSCRDPEGHLWNFGTYDPWAPG